MQTMNEASRNSSRPVKTGLAVVVAVLFAGIGYVAWQQHRASGDLAMRLGALEERVASVGTDARAAAASATKEATDRISALSDGLQGGIEAQRADSIRSMEALATSFRQSEERLTSAAKDARDASETAFKSAVGGIASLRDDLNGRLDAQREEAAGLRAAVDRALGHVVVTQPPEDLRAAVRATLDRWLPAQRPAQLPPDGTNLRDELAILGRSMETGLRSAFDSELRRLHWWADVLDAVQSVHEDVGRAESDYPQLRELRISAPILAPQWCFDAVRSAERRKLLALVQMRAAQDQATVAEVEAVEDLLNAVRREMGSDVPAFVAEASARLDAKRRSIVSRERSRAIDELVAERSRSMGAVSDPSILLQLQAGYSGQLMGLLCSLPVEDASEGKRIEALARQWSREMRGLDARIRNDQSLGYQKWALDQIKGADDAGEKASGTFNDDESEIMSAICDHLLPIDTALLDPPIRMKFDETWTKWKGQLKAAQLGMLLERVASIPKKGLGEV